MPEYTNLISEFKEGILTLKVNREHKLNALNIQTLEELRSAVQSIYDRPEIKGAIITGSGSKAFVAGADISEISGLDQHAAQKFAENGQGIFRLIEECPKPVLAAVNGFALGGGCELAMACHIRVALTSAKFGQPEVNLGIIPGYGGTQRLTRLIGKSRALELMMTADIIPAQKAAEYGLVNHLADTPEAMLVKCRELLDKITAKAPVAIGMVINSVNALYAPEQPGYLTEAENFGTCCSTEDFKEGTRAFLEKRTPKFQGK
jgi:enoyl-CoA hydratase